MEKIFDYISGKEINGTPEELDSIQPISKELVENLLYSKKLISTRPQYFVKATPSDKKGYPVDIVVFENEDKTKPYIIIEGKRKERKDGLKQLKIYLSMSEAEIGVWDNGQNRIIIQKFFSNNKIDFREIPAIPKFGEDIESIGNYTKKDLIIAKDLKSKFKSIRNWLAANNSGATRDETIANQLIYVIFCKIWDERHTEKTERLKFTMGISEKPSEVEKKIKDIWKKVKTEMVDIFNPSDKISLDSKSISYIVKELQQYYFMKSNRHVMSEAFETFIGHSLKGEQGQFFTPRNVVELAINMVDPDVNSKIIDPACGTGGFLIEATKYVWNKIKNKADSMDWDESQMINEQKNYAINNVYGIDKDEFLSKVTKAYMMLIGDGKSGIFNANSLDRSSWSIQKMKDEIKNETFDFVFANPPYGTNIKIDDKKVLKGYSILPKVKPSPPQTLFIELMFDLLKYKGKLAIVMPDSLLGNKTSEFERDFIVNNGVVEAIVSLPLETFQPHTSTKTSLIIIRKEKNPEDFKDNKVFISAPKTCGHNRRGEEIESDDVTLVAKDFKEWKNEHNIN